MQVALLLTDVGPRSIPQDVRRLRRQVGDALRTYGQPVVHLHKWNLDDEVKGLAKKCPACFETGYNNPRNDCQVCYGQGFVSTENSTTHWIAGNTGTLTTTDTGIIAPRFGGYAEPVLTRLIEPDAAIDIFKLERQGTLTRVQQAQGVGFWTPEMGDNDTVVNVSLSRDGSTINNIYERYELKQTNPQTVRGASARRVNNSFKVSQSFEMTLLPVNTPQYKIPIPVTYGEI
jgi:hypothetical protein